MKLLSNKKLLALFNLKFLGYDYFYSFCCDQIYSTQRIYKEARRRGHKVEIINHLKCSIKLGDGKPSIIYQGKNIIDIPDVIILE